MNPRIFIGSSIEGKDIAEAIHAGLQRYAECTVWTDGVFGLSKGTLDDLMRLVGDSDFGIFVFSPDDTVEMRGKLFSVPRDNVVYELGLFSGALGKGRCFFVIPMHSDLHVPSDLFGTTPGIYETDRSDTNWKAAVGPFCSEVRKAINDLGSLDFTNQYLRDLIVQYDCCDWINSDDPSIAKKVMDQRIERRKAVYGAMIYFCRSNHVNKRRLLRLHSGGFYAALAAAISTRPAKDDDKIILAINPKAVPHGFAQHVMVDAITELDKKGQIEPSRRIDIVAWAEQMTDLDGTLKGRIATLKSGSP